jgi:hypothetical protein
VTQHTLGESARRAYIRAHQGAVQTLDSAALQIAAKRFKPAQFQPVPDAAGDTLTHFVEQGDAGAREDQ